MRTAGTTHRSLSELEELLVAAAVEDGAVEAAEDSAEAELTIEDDGATELLTADVSIVKLRLAAAVLGLDATVELDRRPEAMAAADCCGRRRRRQWEMKTLQKADEEDDAACGEVDKDNEERSRSCVWRRQDEEDRSRRTRTTG